MIKNSKRIIIQIRTPTNQIEERRQWTNGNAAKLRACAIGCPHLDQVQESARPQKIQYYRRTIHGKGGECSFCWRWTLDARGKKSDFVYCLYALAGYNGTAFTPWVTLPGEKLQTCIAHSIQGHHPATMRQHIGLGGFQLQL
ncbi:hypothetical protein AVEN_274424-1 [Araneus ventricosus]|uniref:Uncharacterized protein n=1 Tax=Araneus ventricosus TaxID=182803 RepID=A0A4Y2E6P8_ARAVE|nr:hypothetical protein AVEN_274424-1 [Araneus ventricosus]